ncbi:MAG: alpha/beta hydrolase [Hyphomonadaceae bacterium]|nr:alpha/beta hydrolase [Hyphomonadaceae bacterium]
MGRLTRRALGVLAAGAAAASVGAAHAAPRRRNLTFVLVHGAWHGGWCWERVAARLQARGHRVYAPTLTGLGERSHLISPAINLDTHIADVTGELRWKDLQGVTLVGHSYGGMVITGVVERAPERIASIVYLDAFLPQSGQSLNDMVGFVSGGGADPVAPIFSAEATMVNLADRAWVDAQFTPQSAASFSQKLTHTNAYDRVARKTYIRPIDFPSPFSDAVCAPLRQDPSWRVHDIRGCGHDVMIDKPAELARLLEAA